MLSPQPTKDPTLIVIAATFSARPLLRIDGVTVRILVVP